MFNIPIEVNGASEETILFFVNVGALYLDEHGIHANKSGSYPKQEEIPTQTANPSGDE